MGANVLQTPSLSVPLVASPCTLEFSAGCADMGASPRMAPMIYDFAGSRSPSPVSSHKDSKGTGAFLGGRYSREDLVSFGGISEAEPLVRTSERIRMQANADDTQLERAMHLSAAKNTGSFTGKSENSKFFLSSISNDDVLDRADKLGVSLGESPRTTLDTINLIKNADTARTMIMLTKNLEEKLGRPDDSNSEVLNHASLLSSDLGENEGEGSDDILGLTLAEIKLKSLLKKKKKKKKVQVRRSKRLNK
jgi:hypothetical protein